MYLGRDYSGDDSEGGGVMALIENMITQSGIHKVNKVDQAIQRFKSFEPQEGYWLAFSGGKDSVVIKRLAEMARVKFEAHYSVTSVDPPELVRFVKSMPDVSFDIPRDKDGSLITMWNLIPRKLMPPTRLARYCCEKLKESNGVGRVTVTGVRWAESTGRRKNQSMINDFGKGKGKGLVLNTDNDEARRMVENCYRTSKILMNPIIDWTDEDVWEFIRTENIPYCGLYDCGYKRLGCIGCPMNTKSENELNAYPSYKNNYLKAFNRMLDERKRRDKPTTAWNSAEEVMDWWLGKIPNKQADGQIDMMKEIEDAGL